jgi:hypothetical protein
MPYVLSEAQFNVLSKLDRGEKVVVPRVTRAWLARQGYVTVKRVGRTHVVEVTITELGRHVIANAVKRINQLERF